MPRKKNQKDDKNQKIEVLQKNVKLPRENQANKKIKLIEKKVM